MDKKSFYTELAKYYDKIYHHIDYNKQADFVIQTIKEFNTSENNKILDVACGTGAHAVLLNEKGCNVSGLDISEKMLEQAKKKNPEIKFIQADMKEFNLNEKFGAIICFFNSILYNKNKQEMKKSLLNFYSHLEKGGILIFDFVDKSIGINSEKEEYRYEDDNLKILFQPKWVYSPGKDVMDLEIDFTINGEKLHDHHTMGAFSFEELNQILQEAGFEIIKQQNTTEKSAVFICRK